MITELKPEAGSKTYQTRTVALGATKEAVKKYLGPDANVQLMCSVTEGGRYFYVTRLFNGNDSGMMSRAANFARAGFFIIG